MHCCRSLLRSVMLMLQLFVFWAMPMFAQDPPDIAQGMSPSATYHGGDFDFVDMVTGRLHLEIPLIVDHSQRGNLNFTYSLTYTSSGSWVVGENAKGQYQIEPPAYGVASPGVGNEEALTPGAHRYRDPSSGDTFYEYYASDGAGGQHPLGFTSGNGATGTSTLESIDGSGVGATWSAKSASYQTNKSGVQWLPAGFPVDPNGNELSPGNSGTTDTMGRFWTTTNGSSDVSGCPTKSGYPVPHWSMIWTVPGPANVGNGIRTFKFCYAFYAIQTNFPIGIQYNSPQTSLMTGVVLPDGTTWRFDYDNSTYSLGDLLNVSTPTGGNISYTWVTGGPCGVSNAYARYVATRTVNDGVNSNQWTYTWGNFPKVTDPIKNDTVYTQYPVQGVSCSDVVGQIDYYSGPSGGSATPVKTVKNSYLDLPNPFPTDINEIDVPDPQLLISVATIWASGQQSQVQYTYDSGFTFFDNNPVYGPPSYSSKYGLRIVESHSDYGSGAPGAVISTTNTTYKYSSDSRYLTANILDLPSSVIVTDGSTPTAKVCAETDYGYDEYTLDQSNVSEQHVAAPNPVMGNQTSVTRQYFANPCTSTNPSMTPLKTANHFYDTGMIHTVTDPKNNPPTTHSYSGTYYGAYPTTVCDPLNQCTNYGHDFNTGLITSLQDPNSQTTSFTWDIMLRPTQANYPDGGQETFTPIYSGGYFTGATLTKKITSSLTNSRTTTFDGLGRETQTKASVSTSTCSGGYAYVDTSYDADGRKNTVSNPDCTSTSSDDVKTTYNYDPLSRVASIVEQDGSTVSTDFSNFPCITVTDETGKARKSCSDGNSRLTGVWEDPGSAPHLNYETDYHYDALGNLNSITQNGSRQRTFTYDSLSRLTSSINPESNTVPGTQTTVPTTYSYDADSNLSTKTEPAPNQTGTSTATLSYCYDALNRTLSKAYTSQACPMASPIASYSYDGSGCLGQPSCYNVGHRTGMTDSAGSEAWSYDKMGRTAVDQRTTNNVMKATTYANSSVPYNYDGSIAQLIYPSGRTITYTPDIAFHQIQAVDTANSINYAGGPTTCPNGQAATGACYTPRGSLASLKNGSSIITTAYYNTRMQPCRIAIDATGAAPTSCADMANKGDAMDYSYDFHLGASDNGNVFKISNNRTSASDRNINYTYDSLNRIATAFTDGNLWGETYSIDPWGNLYGIGPYTGKPAGESLSQGVNGSNQLTNACSANCYDTAGNLLNDGLNSYTYDAEGHIITGAGVTYYYDGDGKRVRKSSGTLYWFGMSNDALDETDGGGNLTNEYVFFDGKRIARRDASSNVFYYFTDHLGTSRAIVQQGQNAPCYDQDFYPFGREVPHTAEIPAFVNTCPQNYKFTGKERDSESGLDSFGARYDSSQYGRFTSADPVWVKADRMVDPQRLNLYAYGRNNPLKLTDPTGMDVNLGNCPGDMTTTMCEAAVRNGLQKEDRSHVHFVEGNGKNGYKKGEVGVLVDSDYKSKSLNFTTLQSLANDHTALAKIDIFNPNDKYSFRTDLSYPPKGLSTVSSTAADFGGYTFFQFRGKEEPGILYSTGDFTNVVVSTDPALDLSQSIFHELQHVFLGDFGRSALKGSHLNQDVNDRTNAAEKEALENEKNQ
jgi:RHS repeat-associated protein